MIVSYQSVPLAYVERAIDPNEPIFFDTEGAGLYVQPAMAQFKQPSWDTALIVEYPNYIKLQQLLKQHHIVAYPIAYDLGTMRIQPKKIDCMYIASKSAFPLLEKFSLDNVAPQFYFGVAKSAMQKSFMKKREAFTDEQLHYGALDVYALEYLWNDKRVKEVLSTNLSYKVDMKNQLYALGYQQNGMPVIQSEWLEARVTTEANRVKWQSELNEALGTELNVKSWKQKQEAFPELPFNELGKQPTDEKAFKKLYLDDDNPLAKLVLDTTKARTQLQDLEKYSESYYPDENPIRIRTFFNVAGAITGRYSSKGGDLVGHTNIQNIGRHFKHLFGYEEGTPRRIISADYGTAEMIAGCSIFGVDTLREQIMDGLDLHKAMAMGITGKSIDEITKSERQEAKAVNFGYLFGMGIARFKDYAYDTFGVKLTEEQAKEFKDLYYDTHPAIAAYHKQMAKNIKRSGYTLKTALGRVVHPQRYADALNIPVQGTIGECTKMAINFLMEDYPSLMKEGMLINMIHDSVILDFPEEYAEEAGIAVSKSMKIAWYEISKSSLFHYHDLPIGVDVDIAMCLK